MINIANLGFGGSGIPNTLYKAIAELQGLSISLLAGVGANTAIAVPGIDLGDKVVIALEHVASAALVDVTSQTSVVDRRASGTLTLSGVVAGDMVSVDGKQYTFVANPGFAGAVSPYQVAVGATDTISAANLASVLMSCDSNVSATSNGAVVTVYWRVLGTVGNTVALSVAASNGHVTESSATLAGGSDTQSVKIGVDTTNNQVILVWFNSPTQGK